MNRIYKSIYIFYFILIILCKFCFSRSLSIIPPVMSAILVVIYYMYYNLYKVSIMIPLLLFLTVIIMSPSLPYQSNQILSIVLICSKNQMLFFLMFCYFFLVVSFSVPLIADIIAIISFPTLNLGLLLLCIYDVFMADPQAIDFQTFSFSNISIKPHIPLACILQILMLSIFIMIYFLKYF